jgi:16S rRNA (cytosine1402-N4)-methyltransferase
VKILGSFAHETVLKTETVEAVLPHDGGRYIDCTVGGGGHSRLLLERSAPTGRLLGLDQDPQALDHAQNSLRQYLDRVDFAHANFRRVKEVAIAHAFTDVDGVIFDLGVSSPQFDEPDRGFSYKFDADLDMRMDTTAPTTAYALVNGMEESELVDIFFKFGEEKFSRAIARAIVRERTKAPIETTVQLADIVKSAIPAAARRTGPHPARRVFQALRIAVNDELTVLQEALCGAFEILKPGGRIAAITFHSLEDRIVKQTFANWSQGCICPPEFPVCVCGRQPEGKLVTRKPIYPADAEIGRNSRARSAKLRVIERL